MREMRDCVMELCLQFFFVSRCFLFNDRSRFLLCFLKMSMHHHSNWSSVIEFPSAKEKSEGKYGSQPYRSICTKMKCLRGISVLTSAITGDPSPFKTIISGSELQFSNHKSAEFCPSA